MPPIKFADIAWPATPHYWIANARVPACLLGDLPDETTPRPRPMPRASSTPI